MKRSEPQQSSSGQAKRVRLGEADTIIPPNRSSLSDGHVEDREDDGEVVPEDAFEEQIEATLERRLLCFFEWFDKRTHRSCRPS